ncbi:unnamed protein product, partial [Nesidiocoris tenuis]
MAEFIRGGCGTGIVLPKENKLHGSPSTGSDEGHDPGIGEDFDPFLAEQDEVLPTGTEPNAPPES